jgi:PAS domain S-box-containing protein
MNATTHRPTLRFAAVLLICFSSSLHAQQERTPAQTSLLLTQYAFEQWDDRDGLPQNSVQAMTQSKDGYLWFGTQSGVARFDGVRFDVLDGADSPALQRAYVWAVEPAADGGIWIGTEEGGLIHSANGKFTSFTTDNGLKSNWVSALHLDRSGNLWVGTMGGGLVVRWTDGRFEAIDSARGLPARNIFSIAEDTSGIIWIGTGKGLTRIRQNRVKTVPISDVIGPVTALVARPGGGVYAGAGPAGLVQVINDDVQTIAGAAELGGPAFRSLVTDESGAIWAGMDHALVRIDKGVVSKFASGRGPQNAVVSMQVDNEGSIWLGTDGGGLARMRKTPIVPLGTPEGLTSDMIFPVLQARNGDVWLGSGGSGVDVLRNGKVIARYTVANKSLPQDFITSFAEDHDGAMWVGTTAGVSRIKDGKAQIFTAAQGLLPGLIRVVHIDSKGGLWVGSHFGLQQFRPSPSKVYTTENGLADNFVMTILEDRRGTMWVATRDGLSRFANGSVQTFTKAHGVPDHGIMALFEDRDGVIWIGTDEGLARLRGGRIEIFSVAKGFCAPNVMSILEDDDGRLWLGSLKGIFAVEKQTLGTKQLSCTRYERAAGMRSREANGAVNPAAWRMSDGRMWFGTIKGVAIVDPRSVKLDLAPPPVQIEEVVAQGRRFASMPERLSPGVRAIDIHFTGLSFVSPELMRFRYKLEGYDEDWVDAGTRRVAYYTHLHPRKYTFRVQAANAEGTWNQAGASVAFAIAPRWFETWEFKILVMAILLIALWALYRLRVHGMKARQYELQELADERGRAEARYRELFENATDAVFTTGVSGDFTGVNRKAELLTGYTREEMLRLNVRELLPRVPESDRIANQWLNGAADGSERVEIISKSGERVPVEVSTRTVTEGGVKIGIQAIARDVTDRAALERQLRQSQKMDAVGQLAGGVAHDFNNLLTVIRGNGELLLADLGPDDPAREDLEQINLAADRASALTRQLLAFSRKQVVHPRALNLNDLLRDLEKMLQRLIGEDLTILTLPSVEPARIMADPTQIEQVLINLVVNARDAMPRGGSITIETRVMDVDDVPQSPVRTNSGRAVVLTVSDNGKGMDAATQALIFEPFFTTKDPGKGTGLGLSTVYGIVQQAGGQIACSSTPGVGTTFRIYLPYVRDAVHDGGLEEHVAQQRGHETILLVEDEDAVRTLASRVLRHNGYLVLEARHGQDALNLSHDHKGDIDLLLTDVVLPAMNGRVLSERLLQYRPDLKVLLMSGYTDDEILRRGLFEPGMYFLQKPFTPQALLRRVRAVLDSELGAVAD